MSIKEILKRYITEVDCIKEVRLSPDDYDEFIAQITYRELFSIKYFMTGVVHYYGKPIYKDKAMPDNEIPFII